MEDDDMSMVLMRDDTYAEFIFSTTTQAIIFRWGHIDVAVGLDDLPASVRGKINMIRLLKRGSYVAGLGGKSNFPTEPFELLSVQTDADEAEQLLKLNPRATYHSAAFKPRYEWTV